MPQLIEPNYPDGSPNVAKIRAEADACRKRRMCLRSHVLINHADLRTAWFPDAPAGRRARSMHAEPSGHATVRLTTREDGRVELRLSVTLFGCVATLRSHGRGPGDTRHITTGAEWRPRPLHAALALLLGLEETRARKLVQFGAIYLGGERAASPELLVEHGVYLRAHLDPKQAASLPRTVLGPPPLHPSARSISASFPCEQVAMPSHIPVLVETAHFVACDKPAGVPVHGTIDNRHQNVASALSAQLGVGEGVNSTSSAAELLVTSRLDVPTSGVLVLAKTREFLQHFNLLMRTRQIEKRYTALVHARNGRDQACRNRCGSSSPSATPSPRPQPRTPLELPKLMLHWMNSKAREPKELDSEERAGWQRCESEVLQVRAVWATLPAAGLREGEGLREVEGEPEDGAGIELYEIQLRLLTGRTHQLRAQLSFEGFPIVGDTLYGAPPLSDLKALLAAPDARPADLSSPQPYGPSAAITSPVLSLPSVQLPTEPIGLHAHRVEFADISPRADTRGDATEGLASCEDVGGDCKPKRSFIVEREPRWWRPRLAR